MNNFFKRNSARDLQHSVRSYGSSILGYVPPGETSPSSLINSQLAPSVIADHPIEPSEVDYDDIGPIGQVKACLQTMHAIGTYDAGGPYSGASAGGGVYNVQVVAAAFAIGMVFDWSVGHDEARPFVMNIGLEGFVGLEYHLGFRVTGGGASRRVDRSVAVRVPEDISGGRIFLPFAYSHPTAMQSGRATLGQQQKPAKATPNEGEYDESSNVVANGIQISGIPASLTTFGFNCTLMTAFKPETAQFAALLGIS